jgi:hypothetical protein
MVTVIRSIWGGSSVTGGGVTTFSFVDPPDETQLGETVADLQQLWTDMAGILCNTVNVQIDPTVNRYAASTGELQEVFSIDPPDPVVGELSLEPVPRHTQALVRLRTGEIRNGRLIQGRFFLPGLPESANTALGQLDASFQSSINTHVTTFFETQEALWEVWSRPVAGAGGVEAPILSYSVWAQWAVLRSRRD